MLSNGLDLSHSIEWLKNEKILIHPTEGVWGIGCDASHPIPHTPSVGCINIFSFLSHSIEWLKSSPFDNNINC